MSHYKKPAGPEAYLVRKNYATGTLEDELRINHLCKQLLKEFHQHLLQACQLDPLEAGAQAAGADYFLLDFMIDNQRANIFDASDLHLKKFAGNWYIISNLEPNIDELRVMLDGTANFYHYCAQLKLIKPESARQINAACQQIDYYQQRIEVFLDISGDGYLAWEQECPLK